MVNDKLGGRSDVNSGKIRGYKSNCPTQGEFVRNGKRYVRIVGHDHVRDLIIPSQEPNKNETFICPDDLNKLTAMPAELNLQGTDEVSRVSKLKRDEMAEESALRKKELQSYPTLRSYPPRLDKLETEAEAKSNFLLNRAKEVRQEDDDDINLCNKLILGTKCQAIRDAQVAEKQTIMKELMEEEKRLDEMMELERKKAVARDKMEQLRDEERKKAYRKAITEQVRSNELEREVEAERVVEESKILNEAAMQARIDELRSIQKKEAERQRMCEEMTRINKQMLEQIELERKEAKLADLRIQEFMKRKAEEEEKREIERLKSKTEREKELAKLRAKQQKAQDEQSSKDEYLAKRVQDEYERQWRAKEKAVILEKKKTSLKLLQERARQIEDKKLTQAREIEREQQESLKIERIAAETDKRIQQEQERRKKDNVLYKAALLKQINEKEQERIETRKNVFREGLHTVLEAKARDDGLKNTIKKKINNIRGHNVPERYIDEIERKLKVKE
uniref:Cilia- and flagella-associated protein 45 n=1 Tax=Lygus hesperus TaxID=30085 RepID=A0A0K8SH22_LYGHE